MSEKKRTKIAFIIEGTKTEPLIISNLKGIFFNDIEIMPIMLPACTNIYALWCRVNEDEDTDIIELVKEIACDQKYKYIDRANEEDFRKLNKDDFSEIYLFFDYDGHNDNLPKGCNSDEVVKKMLETFDNETENGKMYISYPMIEAVKHFTTYKVCNNDMSCYTDIELGKGYKHFVAEHTLKDNLKKYEIYDWQFILKKFISSIYCLFDLSDGMTKKEYSNKIIPKTIFLKQLDKCIEKHQKIMVLSAIPEFLLDYFKLASLEKYINYTGLLEIHYNSDCKKRDLNIHSFI